MARNQWSDAEAERAVAEAGRDPANRALAMRVYSSRLIGADPDLVMHGGGNTSVKVRRRDVFGDEVDVLHVKGSGWDLDTIEAAGLPGVRMAPLHRLRGLSALSDAAMVDVQRASLLDSSAPNPSVETLLHAYLPHRFVDHTHATAILTLANLPEVEQAVRAIFGDRVALVPYIMPGFALAKAAADVHDANPRAEGLLLVNHGHFTFGATARESYERMIDQVSAAEAWLTQRTPPAPAAPAAASRPEAFLPRLRGAMAGGAGPDAPMPVLDLRCGEGVRAFLARADLARLARRGVASPDHVIRTKAFPLLIEEGARGDLHALLEAYARDYRAYFDRQNARAGGGRTRLAPTPALAWVPGLGLAGIGADAAAARVAADLGEQTLRVMAMGEAAGGYRPIGEDDTFDMEYWPLEQAKLGRAKPPPLRGRVALVTGGAGAIGRAVAEALAARGAAVFLADRDEAALASALDALGRDHGGAVVDLAADGGAEAAVRACVRRFGGLDIAVGNAGAAWTGAMADLPEADLRASFELNFFAQAALARAATAVLRAQGRGGQILFNVSKQAVHPGWGFGAYGLPKAATMHLVRQLALELGPEGVRVNGVNADRIRSGLLTPGMIAARAEARGTDEAAYMAGNLLGREVEARHVGEAFAALALAERTTAHVMTVDGGNVEASLR